MSLTGQKGDIVAQCFIQLLTKNNVAPFIAKPTATQMVAQINDFLILSEQLGLRNAFQVDYFADLNESDVRQGISRVLNAVGMPVEFKDGIIDSLNKIVDAAQRTSRWTNQLNVAASEANSSEEYIAVESKADILPGESDLVPEIDNVLTPVAAKSESSPAPTKQKAFYYRPDKKQSVVLFLLSSKFWIEQFNRAQIADIYSMDRSLHEAITGRATYMWQKKGVKNWYTESMHANYLCIEFIRGISLLSEVQAVETFLKENKLGKLIESRNGHEFLLLDNDNKVSGISKKFDPRYNGNLSITFEHKENFKPVNGISIFVHLKEKYGEDLSDGGVSVLDLYSSDKLAYLAIFNAWERSLHKKDVLRMRSVAERHKHFKALPPISEDWLQLIEGGNTSIGNRPKDSKPAQNRL